MLLVLVSCQGPFPTNNTGIHVTTAYMAAIHIHTDEKSCTV